MFRTKVVEKIKTHCMLNIFFPENRAFYEVMWKNMRAGHAHYMLDTPGYKFTLRICNTWFFFKTETVFASMRFSITSYVLCLLTYSVTLHSIQRRIVGMGGGASVYRSGDADFESQPGH
jgi:hypothetical protein